MIFSKLKISTKLVISSAVFLIPIGVMLFFVFSATAGVIRKSTNETEGINALKPAVTVMRYLPEYLNVYLGLEQGDIKRLDEQITGAVKSLDKQMRSYVTEEKEMPELAADWGALKKTGRNDEELYQKYLDFVRSIVNLINLTGEHSGLILVSDMGTYFLVASSISGIPEASMRLVTVGNLTRDSLFNAENEIKRFNTELDEAHAAGRRANVKKYSGSPADITMIMLPSADLSVLRNSRALIEMDAERIGGNLKSTINENKNKLYNFDELAAKLGKYQESVKVLSETYTRMSSWSAAKPTSMREYLNAVSLLNTSLCDLWAESFSQLSLHIQNNAKSAQTRIIIYLALVFISLALALYFVIFITLDINRSVKNLKTLFRGLNENNLTLSLKITSRDEFGELMAAFNGFLDILRSTFGSFKHSAQLVADSVFDLSSSSKEITTTANEQSASVSEIVSTMEGSKNLSEQIALKTTEVAQLAKETQELSSKGAQLREANQTMMEDIRKQNQKIISEIRNLSDMIIRISEAIRIIDSIADQTKLIAFNASLEASSSGEAGARFSVVASEIRRFADNVVESTREIKQRIEEVQGASQILITEANSGSKQIEIGYERMSEQKIVFEHIVDNSQNVATRSAQISNLSKQQELASTQIFSTLKEISAGVKQFVIATSSTSKIADSLNGMSEELKGKVEKFRTDT